MTSKKTKKKFEVGVEVIRAYTITVLANSPEEACQKAESLDPTYIDSNGSYVDTHIIADDEPEEV